MKVVILTGGTSGIGLATAKCLAAQGCRVYEFSRRDAEFDFMQHMRVDVADAQQVRRAVDEVCAKEGRIDVLVNNAGLGTAVPALKESPEQFCSVVDVNLGGAFWAAKECAAVMGPGSSIVNVASVLGLTAGFAPQAAYSATKAAVMGLTRDLASQWGGRRGIRVNSLAPGYFASEMTDEIPKQMLADIKGSTIFGRLGLQPELDAALLFLASDAASFVTGTTLVVDGGMTMH